MPDPTRAALRGLFSVVGIGAASLGAGLTYGDGVGLMVFGWLLLLAVVLDRHAEWNED